MTTEVAGIDVADAEDPGWPEGPERQYCGYVIIEWPAPRRKDGIPRAMPAWACSVLDAETGKPITTVEKLTVPRLVADVTTFITCDLVMLADEQGMPVMGPGEDGKFTVWLDENGRARTGVFSFLVAEMRVRS